MVCMSQLYTNKTNFPCFDHGIKDYLFIDLGFISEVSNHVLIATFHSKPIQRHFRKYRLISGGVSLVKSREVEGNIFESYLPASRKYEYLVGRCIY